LTLSAGICKEPQLREAIDRVEAYQDFQPDRFDRRALNRQLRLLAQDREVRQ